MLMGVFSTKILTFSTVLFYLIFIFYNKNAFLNSCCFVKIVPVATPPLQLLLGCVLCDRPNFRYNLGVFCAIGLILVLSPNYFPN